MSCNEPIVLPACDDLDGLTDTELQAMLGIVPDDIAYKMAVAMVRAAVLIRRANGFGIPDEQFVTYGEPAISPTCCDAVAVGIVDYQVMTDGACWTSVKPVFELVVSRCKPKPKGAVTVPSGPLDGGESDTLNGHALAIQRLNDALAESFQRVFACYLPSENCTCCSDWGLVEVTVDNEEACTQTRFRVERR